MYSFQGRSLRNHSYKFWVQIKISINAYFFSLVWISIFLFQLIYWWITFKERIRIKRFEPTLHSDLLCDKNSRKSEITLCNKLKHLLMCHNFCGLSKPFDHNPCMLFQVWITLSTGHLSYNNFGCHDSTCPQQVDWKMCGIFPNFKENPPVFAPNVFKNRSIPVGKCSMLFCKIEFCLALL